VAGSADKVKLHSFTHSMNECVSVLKERDLLPALFFTFSRKECERYAEQIQGSLIDSSDTASVKHMIGFHLHRHKEVLESLSQYHQIVRLLERGIAFHHSGLLPLLKEIVELLFSRGFVKILFCTETFAVGLNMPARTVVFLDLKKPSEEGIRLVRPDEYIQMAGRAGRRGKDTRGVVLYLPARNPLSPEELRTVLTGPLVPLTSRLSFHYDFLLKALHAGERLWSTVIDASYWTCQRRVAVESVRAEMSVLAERRATMGLAADTLGAFEEMRGLEAQVKTLTNAPRRKAQVLLDQWKDRHRGPTWDKARAVWVEWERMGHQIAGLERDIVGLTSDVEVCRVAPIVRGLEELGCVGVDRVLTAFGTCCTEFNEGNPLLLGRLYTSGLLASASAAEIVGVLGSFIVDREAEEKTVHPRSLGPIVSDKVKEVLMTIDEWGQEGVRIDRKCGIVSPDAYWSLTTLWVEIGTQWYLGESAAALRLKYDIYEGNLMRGILKLVALVNEWMSVATFCADVHMLDTCRDISGTLMRDLAQPESLYLTM
jgi:superfamily II RNA helicase